MIKEVEYIEQNYVKLFPIVYYIICENIELLHRYLCLT